MDDLQEVQNKDPGHFSCAQNVNPNHCKVWILGHTRLTKVWEDMMRTTLPSWCTLAPLHIGNKGQGKISADRWYVFCMVHLIMTLCCLWGSSPLDSCKNKLLVSFCDLIMATKIAAGRLITIACTKGFQDVMLRYLSRLDKLFPMH